MEYDKPYKSFDELLDVLIKKHGLSTPLPPYAKDVLIGTPYYDLINGYKSHFMVNDRFRDHVTFENIYWFHIFDRGFQNVLFELSIIIEDYFKNVLAHVLAKNFGVDASTYLVPGNFVPYQGRPPHRLSSKKLLGDLCVKWQHPTENPSLYYARKHNHIPPWILFKNITFSDSINLFSLLKRNEKKEILRIMLPCEIPYQDAFPILRYILTMVRRCRNTIAHGLKFTEFDVSYYYKNLSKSALRKIIPVCLLSDKELSSGRLCHGIYGYIFFCLLLIRSPLEKAILTNHIIQYMSPGHTIPSVSISNLSMEIKFREQLGKEYLEALHIPANFTSRLTTYLKDINIAADRKE